MPWESKLWGRVLHLGSAWESWDLHLHVTQFNKFLKNQDLDLYEAQESWKEILNNDFPATEKLP